MVYTLISRLPTVSTVSLHCLSFGQACMHPWSYQPVILQ